MNRTISSILTAVLCLGVAACAWSYYGSPSNTTQQLLTNATVPGRLWAYRVSIPFYDLHSVALEIRRSSEPYDHNNAVGSVSGGLHISHQDAEMFVTTGLISSGQIVDGIYVSTWLIELDELMTVVPERDQWRVAGRLGLPGVSSSLAPKDDFCRGELISSATEQSPNWDKSEICVGRFRSHDHERIYDYYCVVVASDSKSR